MENSPVPKTNAWLCFAFVTVIVIMVAATRWSLEHPYGTSWDESGYINETLIDAQRLVHGMLLRLGGRILIKTGGRPPAYRALALPFLAIFGFHPWAARLMSLACFGLSAWFVFLATRRVAGKFGGALAVLIFSLAPVVVSASMWFSTEGPLYLATSAFLYYVIDCWADQSEGEGSSHWVGLGLALGLGLLSKASFVAIAFPVLAFWLVAGLWGKLRVPSLGSQWKAGALALLIAGPWWALNVRPALAYSESARDYVAFSLGPRSIGTFVAWFNTVLQSLLGFGLSIFIGVVLLAFLYSAIYERQLILDPLQKAALGACMCAGLPIVFAQLLGISHLLRIISPAVIPLAVAVGILTAQLSWIRYGAVMLIAAVLFSVQLLLILVPVVFPNGRTVDAGFVNGPLPWTVMRLRDQWDWTPLQKVANNCGRSVPSIAIIGNGVSFDPPHIEFPWALQAARTSVSTVDLPSVTWLWRFEDGPIDWQNVLNAGSQHDFVVTAPYYTGLTSLDKLYNQHNSEFVERISADPRFQAPITLTLGRFQPIEVFVFPKRGLVCEKPPEQSAGSRSKPILTGNVGVPVGRFPSYQIN